MWLDSGRVFGTIFSTTAYKMVLVTPTLLYNERSLHSYRKKTESEKNECDNDDHDDNNHHNSNNDNTTFPEVFLTLRPTT